MGSRIEKINDLEVLFVEGHGAISGFVVHPKSGPLGYCVSYESAGGKHAAETFTKEWAQWITEPPVV